MRSTTSRIMCIALLLFSSLLYGQQSGSLRDHLMNTHETAGLYFQMQSIIPEEGSSQMYNMLAIPVQVRYERSRYWTFTFRLNQGHQSYGENNLYSLGNLEMNTRYLYGEDLTLLGGIVLPTGTKALDYDQLIATSAGRLPFINAPVTFSTSGFGWHAGISYGQQPNEKTGVAIGIMYKVRDEYSYVKGGGKYDPTDELMVAGGVEYSDGDRWGFMFDLQFIKYSKDKMDGKEVSDPGRGFAFSGNLLVSSLQLTMLYYHRDESYRTQAGEFVPPAILNLKLGHLSVRPFVPYVGFTYTGKGTYVDATTLLLAGFYFEDLKIGGYPWSPFVEVNYGLVGETTKTFGLKAGTNVSFQIY